VSLERSRNAGKLIARTFSRDFRCEHGAATEREARPGKLDQYKLSSLIGEGRRTGLDSGDGMLLREPRAPSKREAASSNCCHY
jgi:hypothetical protein